MEKTHYIVDEGSGSVVVCVNVSGPSETCPIGFPFRLSLSPLRGTAGEVGMFYNGGLFNDQLFSFFADIDVDYVAFSRELIFSPCDRVQCKGVVIIDDRTVEKNESFGLILERQPGVDSRIDIDPWTKITILDNDGK